MLRKWHVVLLPWLHGTLSLQRSYFRLHSVSRLTIPHSNYRTATQQSNSSWGSDSDNNNNARILDDLDKQVQASARSKRDLQTVMQTLDDLPSTPVRNDLLYDDEDLSRPPPSQFKVAAAAAILTASLAYVNLHNLFLTISLASFVFIAATLDDETLSGAIARILGRTTLRSVEVTQPKIKAVARAVVTGEQEVAQLKEKIADLEEEVRELRAWKAKRIKFENGMARYSLNDLRYMARQRGVPDYGTKGDLLVRLVKANIIQFDEL